MRPIAEQPRLASCPGWLRLEIRPNNTGYVWFQQQHTMWSKHLPCFAKDQSQIIHAEHVHFSEQKNRKVEATTELGFSDVVVGKLAVWGLC